MNSKAILFAASVLFVFGALAQEASAQSTGYYPYVIARGADRQIIRSMPIEMRPSRPLHFYGNTVRRLNQGPALPQLPPRGILQPIFSPRSNFRVARSPFFRR